MHGENADVNRGAICHSLPGLQKRLSHTLFVRTRMQMKLGVFLKWALIAEYRNM